MPPTLRLTVLIAMPAPPVQHQPHPDDEEEPPVVELGVVDVSVHDVPTEPEAVDNQVKETTA